MTKYHIAVIVSPGYGHINPILPIVSKLTESGYRVSCPTTDRFSSELVKSGAEALVYNSLNSGQAMKSLSADELSEIIGNHLVEELSTVFNATKSFYEKNRPDLIIHGKPNIFGRVLSAKYGSPTIQIFDTFAENYVFSSSNFLFDHNHPSIIEMGRKLDNFLENSKISKHKYINSSPKSNLVFNPKLFQYEGNTFDDSYNFVGPCLRQSTFDGAWTPPKNNEKPILFISLGTIFTDAYEFFKLCIQTFTGKNLHVVMSVGNSIDPSSLGEIPDSFEIHNHVPQLAVLKHASVFISHAGMNSTMEALYYAVPLVLVPQMPEQEMVAKRVVQLGLGKLVPRESITAETLLQAVSQTLDNPEMAERSKNMQKIVKQAGGTQEAVRVIKSHIKTKAVNAKIRSAVEA